jgi:hypothetical protein
MQSFELSQLAIRPTETDADLEVMIHVRGLVTPRPGRPSRARASTSTRTTSSHTSWAGSTPGRSPATSSRRRSPSPCAASRWDPTPRRRGIGSALLADFSERAHALGKDALQGEVKESDAGSREFLEHRGLVRVGGEKAVVLDLTGIEPPAVDPPAGVRIASRAEVPDRLDDMYAVAVQADEEIPGSVATRGGRSGLARTAV